MPYKLYDYIDAKGDNPFKDWASGLQKPAKAKSNQKLDTLGMHGMELFPGLLTGTPVAGILKMRILAANVQLRPLLWQGPINNSVEFTLLVGAKEVGGKFEPLNAPDTADDYKQKIIAVKGKTKDEIFERRKQHERIS